MDEGKPCPFCGHIGIHEIKYIHRPMIWFRCLECMACGPIKSTSDEAWAAWNERYDMHSSKDEHQQIMMDERRGDATETPG